MQTKKLMFFSLSLGINFNDTSEESQIWFLRNYESYFDEVYYVLLQGNPHVNEKHGKTTLISFGTGNNKLDLLLSPWRLFKFARKVRPTIYLSYEVIFAWWTALLVKIFLRAKVYLLPFCIPEVIYKITGKSLSGKMPIWLERLLIRFNYWFVNYVVTSSAFGTYPGLLAANPSVNQKLIVADILPEATPPPYFFRMIGEAKRNSRRNGKSNSEPFKLIYVGRFNKEKMVDHLIKMMALLKDKIVAHLYLVGNGEERDNLENLASELKVKDSVSFLGYVSNGELPKHFAASDVFVSPLTGCSFREAALCGLPILAYDMDWIQTLPNKEKAFTLVNEGDYAAMAEAVQRLARDKDLYRLTAQTGERMAWEMWAPAKIEASLRQVFEN
jgi:glycosyltransferase involved in cell wall biosynthesis